MAKISLELAIGNRQQQQCSHHPTLFDIFDLCFKCDTTGYEINHHLRPFIFQLFFYSKASGPSSKRLVRLRKLLGTNQRTTLAFVFLINKWFELEDLVQHAVSTLYVYFQDGQSVEWEISPILACVASSSSTHSTCPPYLSFCPVPTTILFFVKTINK